MRRKILWIAIPVLVLVGGLFLVLRDYLTLEFLIEQETQLRQLREERLPLVLAVAFGVYMLISAIPWTAGKSLICGWLLGFWLGLLVVSFASTATAALTLLFSRYLFHDTIQAKYGHRLTKFNLALKREGPFYVFALRLIPVIPFTFVNLAVGLTAIRVRVFWVVSQLGMLPGNLVFVYAGSNLPGLEEIAQRGAASFLSPQLIVALGLLAIFPLAVRHLVDWWSRRHAVPLGPP